MPDSQKRAPLRRLVRRALLAVLVTMLLLLTLFVLNGTDEGWRVPASHLGSTPPVTERTNEVRILAFNIAKCFAFSGSATFATKAEIHARLDRIAEIIAREKADLVYLSEIVYECGPRPIDQLDYLARRGHFHAWASCDNYRFGLPFFRIRTGNALLSRFPLRPIEVAQLAGGKSIWNPTNNRRILWCEVTINDRPLLTASLRNDSFDITNNGVQVEEILTYIGPRPALLAGDFNAAPGTPPMSRLRDTGRFNGEFEGPLTYPSHAPRKCIDYILAPSSWELIEHRVLDDDVSDHRPVISVFRLPE